MSSSDSEAKVTPVSEFDLISRQIDQIRFEQLWVHEFEDLFKDPNDKLYVDRDYVLEGLTNNFNNWTYSWQKMSSGTVGETVTRWIGLGFLEDYPSFTNKYPGHGAKANEISKDKAKITIYSQLREDGENTWAVWKFSVDLKNLKARDKELDKQWKELYSRRKKIDHDLIGEPH